MIYANRIQNLSKGRNFSSKLVVDVTDHLIWQHFVVPNFNIFPLIDVDIVNLNVGCLMEDQQISNRHPISTNVLTSFEKMFLQEIQS